MKALREAAAAGILRTPFVKPGTSFKGVPESELIRLVAGELLFSTSIEPSTIDTVIIASSFPVDRAVFRQVSSSCRSLGFDRHLRVISLCSGLVSDLGALMEAAMRISTGDSEAVLVIGVGVGEDVSEGRFRRQLPEMALFPSPEVAEHYPSTLEERRTYLETSINRAQDALKEGNKTGMKPITLPPYYDSSVELDDITRADAMEETWPSAEYLEGLPPMLVCDFMAPPREGVGALILTTVEKARSSDTGWAFRTTGFKHLGVPGHLRGAGAAVALESLLMEHQLSVEDIDVLEVMETTSAQVLSTLKRLKSHSLSVDGAGRVSEDDTPGRLKVNPSGGSLAYGLVPSCTGIMMLAGLTEHLALGSARLGAVVSEDAGGEALALLIERS
jgi:acetyl-CoA acetyltransferase